MGARGRAPLPRCGLRVKCAQGLAIGRSRDSRAVSKAQAYVDVRTTPAKVIMKSVNRALGRVTKFASAPVFCAPCSLLAITIAFQYRG